jgi:Ser/Thr protein kinase RdoA (MazF antagonist)
MTTLVEMALERYGLSGARMYRLRQGFVGVFRVVCSARGEFCLRMYDLPPNSEHEPGSDPKVLTPPPGRPSPRQLREQLLWLRALARETILLVPEPVPTVDGSLMAYVPSEGAAKPHQRGRHCVLLRWVPGTHKREELSPADVSVVGSYVAGLHNHAQRYEPPEPSALPRYDWHWPFGESVPLWSMGEQVYSAKEMAAFEAAAQRVVEDLQELGYGRDVFGPIHRDLQLGNIVFDGGRVSAIDFDSCGLGHYLLDLAVVLNALRVNTPRIQRPDRFQSKREALLEGYERERPLPEGYRRYLMTFHAMRHVARVNREFRARDSEANYYRALGDRLLRTAVTWLQSNYLKDER